MRNVVTDPLWRIEELGEPIPDTRHACSVCLPTWQSIIDYEEGRDKVTRALKSGYPRFILHPDVEALCAAARQEYAASDQDVLIFPSREAAQRAQRHLELNEAKAMEIKNYHGVYVLVFLQTDTAIARLYWRYTGEGISSRHAEQILASGQEEKSSQNAREYMATFFGQEKEHVHLWHSGMAAIYAAHRFACMDRPGKKTLQVEFPYVDSLRTQQSFGAGVVFLAGSEGEDLQIALQRVRDREFAAVFTELPANPLLKTPMITELAEACRASETLFIIDDTVASHYNVDALKYADLVTTSCTKWISGQGDVMAGATRINPDSVFAPQLTTVFHEENPEGSTLHRLDADTLVANAEGFTARIRAVNTGGEAVAAFLEEHPAVDTVYYPKYVCKEQYDAVLTPHGGYGGLISITLTNPKKTPAFYDALELNKGPSLGTEFTLVSPYTLLAHYDELDWAEDHDVLRHLIRFSIGVEEPALLIERISKALECV